MSYQAVEWAVKDAPAPSSSAWAVLVVLAETASADGTNAYPSRTTIEYRSRLSKSTVKRALADLEKAGLIVRAGTVGDGVVKWSLMMRLKRPESDLTKVLGRADAERAAKAERMAKLRAKRSGGHSEPHAADLDTDCGGQDEPHTGTGDDLSDEVCGQGEPHVGVTLTARGGHGDPVNLPKTSLGIVYARKASAASLAGEEPDEVDEVFEPDTQDWANGLADEDDTVPASFPDSRPDVVEFKDGQDEDESASAEVPSSRDGSEPDGYERANDLPAVEDQFEAYGEMAWNKLKRRNAVVAQQYRPDFLASLARKAFEGDEFAPGRLSMLGLPVPPMPQLAG